MRPAWPTHPELAVRPVAVNMPSSRYHRVPACGLGGCGSVTGAAGALEVGRLFALMASQGDVAARAALPLPAGLGDARACGPGRGGTGRAATSPCDAINAKRRP